MGTEHSERPKSPTVGLYPDSIVAADFNGDGIPDLALTSVDQNIVTILLGNGDGTFRSAPNLDTVSTPQSVATGDFNGDGIADLAVVNAGSILIFLGNGDGTFNVTPANLPTGMSPISVAVGDFNGDGIADLAVVNSCGNSYPCNNSNGTVMIFLGKGDGTFTQVAATPTVGASPTDIQVADFNNDGILDLAVANYGADDTNAVTVLLGNGDGTFKAPAYYDAPGFGIRSLSVGDFNRDGIADLAAVGFWFSTLDYLPGNGDGTFAAAIPVGVNLPLGSGYVASADFNGDGLPDLALPNQDVTGTVVIMLTQLTETATATVSNISPVGTGTHQVDASYPEDSSFSGSISATTGVIAQQVKPTVTVTPASSSINTSQALSVTIAVSAASNDPIATGTVTLTSGSYSSAKTGLSNGSATIIVPAGSLAIGTATLTAGYSGDSDYFAATNMALVIVTSPLVSPTITVTPSLTSITTAQPLTVTIALSGTPAPTGSIKLMGGGYTSTQSLSSGSTQFSIPAGSLAIGNDTFTADYTPDSGSYSIYNGATGTSTTVTVTQATNSAPVISSLSPALTSAGSAAFTLTVNGSDFTSQSTVNWGATALATTYVSATQLTAPVTAAEIAIAGTTSITVQTPAPGGGTSNSFQFEVDSADSAATPPSFTVTTATVAAGSTASYSLTMPSTVESATVGCLNLPTGAACSYSSTTNTLTITTSSTSPQGTYQVTAVFTETVTGSATSWILLPILLLPLVFLRKRMTAQGVWLTACLGIVLLAAMVFTGCGGGGSSYTQPPPPQTHQVVSSGVVTLTIQ